MNDPVITVLCGGAASSEREVSLVSGRAISEALAHSFRVERVELDRDELPAALDPTQTVVFPAMHGAFGEDGQIQALLEARGFAYAGSGPEASRLCMNKVDTKLRLAQASLPVARDTAFDAANPPSADAVIAAVGDDLVVKPMDQGSSVGLRLAKGRDAVREALTGLAPGRWMAEEFVHGREFTVGILEGRGLGIVEVVPKGGVYDYKHKYTAGMTQYKFPAELDRPTEELLRRGAERAFAACGCRDFSRVDIILARDGRFVVLEINTIPGLTPTSLLPKSASCSGYDFIALARQMVAPAIKRFNELRQRTGRPSR